MNGRGLNVLVVDDQDQLFPFYRQILGEALGGRVETVCSPAQALKYVEETLFDAVLCDAKMPFRGALFGGVLLAEEIADVLGFHSVLLMSQYVDVENVRQFGSQLTFMKKPDPAATLQWMRESLPAQVRDMVRRQFAFAAMPYEDAECDRLFDQVVEPAFARAGMRLVRLDRSPFTRGIRERIFSQIRECNLVVFFASPANPNAYLEAGFAYALRKHIVTLVAQREHLPFDIRNDYCIEHGGQPDAVIGAHIERLLASLRCESLS
jgi:CheY-like chemotaxis protein